MAANSTLNLTALDFDLLKENLKEFLKSQSAFKDYNFEGSNINVLLDVLSYNSYLNAFYLNMVASEMFMDSAQKLDSVVSHAKELNYVPKSAKSSVAYVSFSATASGLNGTLLIPKGTLFSGTNSNGSYTFTTKENNTYVSTNGYFAIANLAIYEGNYVDESFVVDYTVDEQKFILSNKRIDSDSLTINVVENNGQSNTLFNKVDTLYNLTSTSNVYFVQSAQNGQYEFTFGDGVLGRIPQNGAVVLAQYRITNGTDGDGCFSFGLDQSLSNFNGGSVNASTPTASANSSGAANAESISTIKFRAPRYFATQQRAVSNDDYKILTLSKFGGQISDVNVYGGEVLEPKQYGRVVVAIKPAGLEFAPDYLKEAVVEYLDTYAPIPIRVLTADPQYIYLRVVTTVQYDTTKTSKLPLDLRTNVLSTIHNFSQDELEKFGNDFRYSRFIYAIDNTDVSIMSNDTDVTMIKRLVPTPSSPSSFKAEFNNSIRTDINVDSTYFTFITEDGVEYDNCKLSDSNGAIYVYTYIDNIKTTLDSSIGSINYTTGLMSISGLLCKNYGDYISVYAAPSTKDILSNQDKILVIEPSDVTISVIEVRN
jgi:hypothetical protein